MIKLLRENKVKLDIKAPKLCEGEKHYVLTVRDESDEIYNLLKCISDVSRMGHSFNVVVDPNNDKYESKFYIDGDGTDKIYDITVEEYKEESDKE